MTGLKLWMLLLLLQGVINVPYAVVQDGIHEVRVDFVGLRLFPVGNYFETQGYYEGRMMEELDFSWIEESDHGDLFKAICYEFQHERLINVHITSDDDSSIVLSVASEYEETTGYMDGYLNNLASRLVCLIESRYKVKCTPVVPSLEQDKSEEEGSDGGDLPPAPVLPPERAQHFSYLDMAKFLP